MKTKLLFFALTLFYSISLFSQVGVGNTNPQASLDISASSTTTPANNDGILIPRMSNFPASPAAAQDGMLIFYTGSGASGKGFYYWNNTTSTWVFLASGAKNTLDEAYDEGGAGNGRTITADNGAVRVNGEDGFVVTGTFGNGNIIDSEVTGSGTRMFFNPNQAAFRAGTVSGGQWESTSVGDFSTAFGYDTTAGGDYSFAFGDNTAAGGSHSTAFGDSTLASGIYSLAFGESTTASGSHSIAFGSNTLASGALSTSFGALTQATGSYSTALGYQTLAIGDYSVATGNTSLAQGDYSASFGNNMTTAGGNFSLAFGESTTANGDYSLAFGASAVASGVASIAFGLSSQAIGSESTAIGTSTTAEGNYSTAMGRDSYAFGANSTALGHGTLASSAYETVVGRYNSSYTFDSSTAWDTDDQLFIVGNGTADVSRSNALTIYKNGLMNINDEYDMPLTDGTANQVMATNGLGQVNFVDVNTIISDSDDQNIQNLSFNNSTNILTVGIENGTAQTVNLSSLNSGGDITQVNAGNGLVGGATIGAVTISAVGTNGITTNANDFRLGGNLIQNTTITNGTNDLIVNANSSGTFKLQDAGINKFELNASGDAVFGGDLYIRDGSSDASSTILARIVDSGTDGILDIYQGGSISSRIHGNGTSYFNGGKVAIGQTGANGFLDILANNSGSEPHINLVDNGSSGSRINFTNTGTTNGNVWTLFGNTNNTTANSRFNLWHTGSGNILTATGNGNVGIGGITPNSTLDVNGTFKVQNTGADKFEVNTYGDAVFGGDTYWRDENTSGTILARLVDEDNDGNFQIYENGSPSITLDANDGSIFNEQGLNRDFRVESDARSHMLWVDADENVVRIGQSTAGGLAENGNTRVVNGFTAQVNYVADFEIDGNNRNTATGIGSTEFLFDVGNLYVMLHGRLLPFDDNVRSLGTSNWRWQALWAGDGTINTSDLRQKKNIKPLEYGLDELMKIETLTFNWKKSSNPATKIGFSAQNLLEVLPEVVVTEESVTIDEKTGAEEMRPVSNLGVYYSDIIPVTVKAIQELNTEVITLKEENKILRAKLKKLETLEARILALENE